MILDIYVVIDQKLQECNIHRVSCWHVFELLVVHFHAGVVVQNDCLLDDIELFDVDLDLVFMMHALPGVNSFNLHNSCCQSACFACHNINNRTRYF